MRVNKVGLFLGTRGSGKTYYTTKVFIPFYQRNHPDLRILVIDTLDHPDYAGVPRITPGHLKRWKGKGYYRMFGGDTEVMMQAVMEDLRNCLLIIEDASKFLGGTLDESVKRFVLDSKQRNLDIVFMFHSFGFAPPKLLQVSDFYMMFRTADPSPRKSQIMNFQEVYKAWQDNQKSKEKWPRKLVQVY